MPFYSRFISFSKFNIKIIKESATLQGKTIYGQDVGKRVYINASVTVEAAMVFSVFLLAFISLSGLFDMLDTQRKMQATVDKITKDASLYSYVSEYLKDNDKKAEVKSDDISFYDFGGNIGEASLISLCMYRVSGKAKQNRMSALNCKCKFMEADEKISLELSYKYNLPFSIFGKIGINQKVFSERRAYVGKDSRLKSKEEKKSDDTIVYIGKNPTRYHTDRKCHYLHNELTAVEMSEVGEKRNANGGKYSPCARCAKNKGSGTVYIMPSGTSYHTDKNCSAIKAYVRAVKKSDVEYLGACSYCGSD